MFIKAIVGTLCFKVSKNGYKARKIAWKMLIWVLLSAGIESVEKV